MRRISLLECLAVTKNISSNDGAATGEAAPRAGIEYFVVRKAVLDDIDAIKRLADTHRHEVGFVVRASLIESCRREELFVASRQPTECHECGGVGSTATESSVVAFVQGYFRRDRQVTLHGIVVEPTCRRHGVGQALVVALIDDANRRAMQHVLLRWFRWVVLT